MYSDNDSSRHNSDSMRVQLSSPSGTISHHIQPTTAHCDSPRLVHASDIPGFDPVAPTLRGRLSIDDLLNPGKLGPSPQPSRISEPASPPSFLLLAYPLESTPNVLNGDTAFQDRVTDDTDTQDRECGRRPHWRSVFRPYVPPADGDTTNTRSQMPEKRRASRSPLGVEGQWRARRRSDRPRTNDEATSYVQDGRPFLERQHLFRDSSKGEGKTVDVDTNNSPVRTKRPSRTEERREAAAAQAVRRREGDKVQLELLKLKIPASAEEGGNFNNSTVLIAANGYIDHLEEKVRSLTEELVDKDHELETKMSRREWLRAEWARAVFINRRWDHKELRKAQACMRTMDSRLARINADIMWTKGTFTKIRTQVKNTKVILAEARADLNDTMVYLAETKAELAEANTELAEANAELVESNAKLAMKLAVFEESKKDTIPAKKPARARSCSV
ncbi:hypothetical protein DENSPDRAFT_840365 [Dentipellis sp. KUC8613]|nr:hypothetical protein DENSPDRAFT_840365 [Dentipellis sp. KUC8613]